MRSIKLSLLVSLAAACGSQGGGGGFLRDLSRSDGGGGGDMAGAEPDLAMPPGNDMAVTPADLVIPTLPDLSIPKDLSVPKDLSAPKDFAVVTDLAVPTNCHLVINEFMTEALIPADGGTPVKNFTEEFVEVYNPCNVNIDLTGWKLVYRSSSNVTPGSDPMGDNLLYAWTGITILAKGYLVYGGTNFFGTQDDKLKASLAGQAGAIGLRDANGMLVDSVAYGGVNQGHGFIESVPASTPPVVLSPGLSLVRMPNGTDTDVNFLDFKNATAITPRAANK